MVLGRNPAILLTIMVLSVVTAYLVAYYLPSQGINIITFGQVFSIGLCNGTATACSSFNAQTSCQSQSGCSWTPVYSCTGSYNCNQFGSRSTCINNGCTWDSYDDDCRSRTLSCGRYTTQSSCQAIRGCAWSPSSSYHCSGTATPCSSLNNQTACQAQSGCSTTCNITCLTLCADCGPGYVGGGCYGLNTTNCTCIPPKPCVSVCTYGTIDNSVSIDYSNYKIFADTGMNGNWTRILVKNQTGSLIDVKIIYQGDSADFLKFTVKVMTVKALQDGTIVGVDVAVSPQGIFCPPNCVRNKPVILVSPSTCVCPAGYTQQGDECTPNCYFNTPPCLMPSISCNRITSVNAKLGDTHNFTANVTNTDSSECGNTTFVFNGSQEKFTFLNITADLFNFTANPNMFNLTPGNSQIVNFSYGSNFIFANNYSLNVTASDVNNISHSGTAFLTYNVAESVFPLYFKCSSITNGHRCDFGFISNYLQDLTVLFLVSNSRGKVVSSGGATTIMAGLLTFNFYCSTFGPGAYTISWFAYKGSDVNLTKPISYSTTSEDIILNC